MDCRTMDILITILELLQNNGYIINDIRTMYCRTMDILITILEQWTAEQWIY